MRSSAPAALGCVLGAVANPCGTAHWPSAKGMETLAVSSVGLVEVTV